jgi:hypothetical protein
LVIPDLMPIRPTIAFANHCIGGVAAAIPQNR